MFVGCCPEYAAGIPFLWLRYGSYLPDEPHAGIKHHQGTQRNFPMNTTSHSNLGWFLFENQQ